MADKAYPSAANRTWLRRRGIRAVIPVKTDQAAHRRNRGSFGGHPHRFDPLAYKERNVVERCINKLKQFRAVATRYDKRQRMRVMQKPPAGIPRPASAQVRGPLAILIAGSA